METANIVWDDVIKKRQKVLTMKIWEVQSVESDCVATRAGVADEILHRLPKKSR
jgi:hypothetical protein